MTLQESVVGGIYGGARKPIDTNGYFVICSNVLGGAKVQLGLIQLIQRQVSVII